jgi:hypothetical protein
VGTDGTPALGDGTYDVIVVDAEDAPRAEQGAGAVRLSLTVLAGPHKGEVVEVEAQGLGRGALDLLAEPGTLVVEGGRPHVRLG